MKKKKQALEKDEVVLVEEGGKTYEVTRKRSGDEFWRTPSENRRGRFHRELGPAVTWYDGSKFWYQNGQFHCETGPAIIMRGNKKTWYLEGTCYTQEEWLKILQNKKMELI